MPVTANILVISDEAATHISDCLSDEGFSIAHSPYAAVPAMEQPASAFDLAIVTASDGDLSRKDELIDQLRADDVPVLIVGANHRPADIQSVPLDFCDLELKRRIASLIRLEIMKREYQRRTQTTSHYGFIDQDVDEDIPKPKKISLLLVGNQSAILGDILLQLNRQSEVHVCPSADMAVEDLRAGDFDAVIILGAGQGDIHFRLCMDLRADSRLFNLPAIFVLENENNREAAYIHGASDIVMYPDEMTSLFARTRLLVDQSDYRFSLQKLLKSSKPLAVSDGLTGLYSYGFLQAHMTALIKDHQAQSKFLSIATITVDNISDINEHYGYPAGDQVLRQIGNIASFLVRGEDFCGRYRGNQFVIALPSTGKKQAFIALNRVYSVTRNTEFAVTDQKNPVTATINMGLVELGDDESLDAVIKRCAKGGFTKD